MEEEGGREGGRQRKDGGRQRKDGGREGGRGDLLGSAPREEEYF